MSFFRNLFSPKEKDKPEPKTHYEVAELKKGFIVDYDATSWIVEDASEYTWMDGSVELEFTINSGQATRYLNCNKQSGNLSIFWEDELNDVWKPARTKLLNETVDVSDGFHFDGRDFVYFGNGEAEVVSSTDAYSVKNWLFECTKQEYLISFNKYEDNSTTVFVGKRLKKHEIDNILRTE